jgi:putative ABC transport system substrate-binding protein
VRRREFITLVRGAATGWPLAARAQQTATHRIAVVSPSTPVADISETGGNPFPPFFKELRRLGYIEGVNLVVTRYSGGGREDRFPEL